MKNIVTKNLILPTQNGGSISLDDCDGTLLIPSEYCEVNNTTTKIPQLFHKNSYGENKLEFTPKSDVRIRKTIPIGTILYYIPPHYPPKTY